MSLWDSPGAGLAAGSAGAARLRRAQQVPLWLKYLLVLAVTVLVVALRTPAVVLTVLAVVVLLHLLAGMPGQFLVPLRRLWPLLLIVLVTRGVSEALNGEGDPVAVALLTAGGVYAALTAARLLLLTTPAADLLEGLEAFFRRVPGVHAPAAALAVHVMVRSIPWIGTALRQTGEALTARGLRRTPRRLFTPVLIAVVGYARSTGEALAARGLPAGAAQNPADRREDSPSPGYTQGP